MKELFGQRLREQRLKHHLTLEQVAEKADLSANYIEGLTPMQKKVSLDLLDTYITNLPYLTKEE